MVKSLMVLVGAVVVFLLPTSFWSGLEAFRAEIKAPPDTFYYSVAAFIGILLTFVMYRMMRSRAVLQRTGIVSVPKPLGLHGYMGRLRDIIAKVDIGDRLQIRNRLMELQQKIDSDQFEEALQIVQVLETHAWASASADAQEVLTRLHDVRGELYDHIANVEDIDDDEDVGSAESHIEVSDDDVQDAAAKLYEYLVDAIETERGSDEDRGEEFAESIKEAWPPIQKRLAHSNFIGALEALADLEGALIEWGESCESDGVPDQIRALRVAIQNARRRAAEAVKPETPAPEPIAA